MKLSNVNNDVNGLEKDLYIVGAKIDQKGRLNRWGYDRSKG